MLLKKTKRLSMHKVFTKNVKTTNFLARGTLGFNCGFAVPLVSAFANQSKIKLFLASTNNLASCTLPVFEKVTARFCDTFSTLIFSKKKFKVYAVTFEQTLCIVSKT